MKAIAARLTGPLLRPTQSSVRGYALASIIANAVLICTGAAVRLSSSGLGCPDWPRCTKTSLVASHSVGQTSLNTAIEFGNRLLTYPLVIIAGLTFIACLRYRPGDVRRRDLAWLSAALPAGVIAQAVAGGIVVLTRLNPAMVAVHFLLSSAILAAAVVLHVRAGEGAGSPRPLVRADLRVVATLLAGVTCLMLVAGTVVTGTGPLAGTTIDSHGHRLTVPRFHFTLQDVTQMHADIGWFVGALAVALVIGLRYGGAPARVVRLGWMVLAGLAVQGTLGYVQYFSHLPAGLVWTHVATSVVLWILVLRLLLSTRERLPLPPDPQQASGPSVAAEPLSETAFQSLSQTIRAAPKREPGSAHERHARVANAPAQPLARERHPGPPMPPRSRWHVSATPGPLMPPRSRCLYDELRGKHSRSPRLRRAVRGRRRSRARRPGVAAGAAQGCRAA